MSKTGKLNTLYGDKMLYNVEFVCNCNGGVSFFDYKDLTADDAVQAHEIALDKFKSDTKPLLHSIVKVTIDCNEPYMWWMK